MNKILRILLLAVSAGLALPLTVQATPMYGCAASPASKCNGNEYAVFVKSHVGNTYQLQLDIKVLSTYTGSHWSDRVAAVQLKNFAPSYSNISLIDAPDGAGNWVLSDSELNANGCTGGSGSKGCVYAKSPYPGASFTAGDVLSWVIQFDAASLNSTMSLKYLYVDSNGDKVGDLGSWDIGTQTNVPEPATIALLGMGLLGLGLTTRRRHRRT